MDQIINPVELKIAEKLRSDEVYRKAFFLAHAADSVALQIRELRQRLSLSQAELAAKCGMKQSAISRIEKGEHPPSYMTLERIAEALNCRLIVNFQPIEDAIDGFKE